MSVDGDPRFEYRMNGFTHDLSRCCDAVSHYPMQLTSRNEVIRLAQLAESPTASIPSCGSAASSAPPRARNGASASKPKTTAATARSSNSTFSAARKRSAPKPTARPSSCGPKRRLWSVPGRDLTARIPAGAVYEPIFCRPEQRQAPASDSTAAILSPAYRILGAETPLRRPMTISVHAFVPDDMQSRTVLATRTAQRTHRLHRRQIRRRRRDGDDPHHGDIFVAADTIPPRIRPLFSEGADLGGAAASASA